MTRAALKQLFDRYLADDYSAGDLEQLLTFFELEGEARAPLAELIEAYMASPEYRDADLEERVEKIGFQARAYLTMLTGRTEVEAEMARLQQRPRLPRVWPYAAVATVITLVAFLLMLKNSDRQSVDSLAATEILPGGNKAILTLADGRIIDLSTEQTGITVSEENITYDDGISSVVMLSGNEASVNMLSLTTPKGGTYQITLPDGSKVWLNSASTLSYPSRFTDEGRLVEIVGEGYFEIEKDTKRPFIVRSEGQELTVLGTAFNIAAYQDDPETKTTLVEGKVRLDGAVDVGAHNHAPNKSSVILSPGQQSITRGAQLEIREVNTDRYTAWKDGKIALEGRTLPEILKEVSRWYDIEVVYEGQVPQGTFFGRANRSSNLGTVLRLLESASVGYRMEGRTLFITTKAEVSNLNP